MDGKNAQYKLYRLGESESEIELLDRIIFFHFSKWKKERKEKFVESFYASLLHHNIEWL